MTHLVAILGLTADLDGDLIPGLFAPKPGETEMEAGSRCREAQAVAEWVRGAPCRY